MYLRYVCSLLIYYSSGGRREVPTVSTPWFASVPNWIRSTEPPTPTPSEALFIAATEEVLPESFVDDELMLQMKEYVYQPLKPVQHPTSRPLTVTECVAKLASTAINDGYCDCPDDGSDEPDTSACLMGRFLCSKGVAIPSAWVYVAHRPHRPCRANQCGI